MPLQERRSHCIWGDRCECYIVNDCSAVVICRGWRSWGQYLGTWSRHCTLHTVEIAQCTLHTAWREVTNIRSMSQRQYRIREWLSESTHILIGLFTNNTACDTCLPLSPVDITTWKLKPIADEKIEKKKSFMFPHSYMGNYSFEKSNALFKGFLFIQVLSS